MTGASTIPIVAVIIVVSRTRRLINKFRNLGAINETNAKTLEELSINPRILFKKYLFHDVIIKSNERYYLNEQNLKDYRNRKRMILIPMVLVLIFVLIFMDVILT